MIFVYGQIPLRYPGRRLGCSQTGSQLAFDQPSTGLRHAHGTHTEVGLRPGRRLRLDSVMECGLGL